MQLLFIVLVMLLIFAVGPIGFLGHYFFGQPVLAITIYSVVLVATYGWAGKRWREHKNMTEDAETVRYLAWCLYNLKRDEPTFTEVPGSRVSSCMKQPFWDLIFSCLGSISSEYPVLARTLGFRTREEWMRPAFRPLAKRSPRPFNPYVRQWSLRSRTSMTRARKSMDW